MPLPIGLLRRGARAKDLNLDCTGFEAAASAVWATRAIGAPRVIRTPTTVGLNDVSLPIGLPERCSLMASIHLGLTKTVFCRMS